MRLTANQSTPAIASTSAPTTTRPRVPAPAAASAQAAAIPYAATPYLDAAEGDAPPNAAARPPSAWAEGAVRATTAMTVRDPHQSPMITSGRATVTARAVVRSPSTSTR